jgi:hypothetical protein
MIELTGSLSDFQIPILYITFRSFVALLSYSGPRAYEHDLFDLEQFEHRPLAPSQRTFLRGGEYRRSI